MCIYIHTCIHVCHDLSTAKGFHTTQHLHTYIRTYIHYITLHTYAHKHIQAYTHIHTPAVNTNINHTAHLQNPHKPHPQSSKVFPPMLVHTNINHTQRTKSHTPDPLSSRVFPPNMRAAAGGLPSRHISAMAMSPVSTHSFLGRSGARELW